VVTIAAAVGFPITALEVRHADTDRLLWRVAVGPRSAIQLEYVHSLFHAPTTEQFEATAGGLRLVAVSTTKEAVLEHLQLAPPYEWHGERIVARPADATHARLVVRIGQIGRQRLRVDDRELPLYRVGTGEAVEIAVRRLPRAVLWFGVDSR
jgi:hypothetical protein